MARKRSGKRRGKKPLSARQKAIAKGVREGLTPGQAYYRYRLGTNLKKGRTVRESRGHATSEKPTTRQRSKVAKSLGIDLSKSKRHTRKIADKSSPEHVYVLSHLTHVQTEREFRKRVLPAALRMQKTIKRLSFRITYRGPRPYPPHDLVSWSTPWSLCGKDCDLLVETFYNLWNAREDDDEDDEGNLVIGKSTTKILAIHLVDFMKA